MGTEGMFALEAVTSAKSASHNPSCAPWIVLGFEWSYSPTQVHQFRSSHGPHERNKAVWPKLRGLPLKLTCFLGRLPLWRQLKLKVSCGNQLTDGSLQVLGCSSPQPVRMRPDKRSTCWRHCSCT